MPHHTDIRSTLATMNAKATWEEWEEQVVKPVEKVVQEIFEQPDIDIKDEITIGEKQSWGGSYRTVPYWRCQPYFRPVNGITGDKRVMQGLIDESVNKKRKADVPLESADKEGRKSLEPDKIHVYFFAFSILFSKYSFYVCILIQTENVQLRLHKKTSFNLNTCIFNQNSP